MSIYLCTFMVCCGEATRNTLLITQQREKIYEIVKQLGDKLAENNGEREEINITDNDIRIVQWDKFMESF